MGDRSYWCPKMLREHLCQQQTYAPDAYSRQVLEVAIDMLDQHRPVGADGNHGERHTPTCGCEGARPMLSEEQS